MVQVGKNSCYLSARFCRSSAEAAVAFSIIIDGCVAKLRLHYHYISAARVSRTSLGAARGVLVRGLLAPRCVGAQQLWLPAQAFGSLACSHLVQQRQQQLSGAKGPRVLFATPTTPTTRQPSEPQVRALCNNRARLRRHRGAASQPAGLPASKSRLDTSRATQPSTVGPAAAAGWPE